VGARGVFVVTSIFYDKNWELVVVLPPDYPAQEHRKLVVLPPDYPAQEHRELVVVLPPDYPAHRSTGNWWWSYHLIT
jgi:hypothetical protein